VEKFTLRLQRLTPRLADEGFNVDLLTDLYMSGMDSLAFEGPAVWLHGDLHPGNVLVHEGEVHAVIDWGDLCAGDPASDLQIAWMLFDRAARDEFLSAYGAEHHLGLSARARAWAVLSAFVYLDNDAGDPLMTLLGVMTLRRLCD
jgi:Ser/Thr protein kinase RdoA (MazF antagonist)